MLFRKSFYFLIGSVTALALSSLADPAVSQAFACENDDDCKVGEICTGGTCQKVSCLQIFQPVCGADAKTYSNRCFARLAHVTVVHAGECGSRCGGSTGLSCPKSQFCELPVGKCDTKENEGVCVGFPDACPEIWDPVCGCDGKTYSNDCFSRRAGVSILHLGECKDRDGEVCRSDRDCARNESCQFRAPSCGDGVAGVCTEKPEICTTDFDPECGCDGVTYSNTCLRLRAGVSLLHPGECRQACGGVLGPLCAEGEVCDLLPESCNTPDAPGECVPEPVVCPDIWDPVCGCDGETYANDCDRLQAGVAKAHRGPCSGRAVTRIVGRNCYGNCLARCRENHFRCIDDCREFEPGDQECVDTCWERRDRCDNHCLIECSSP